MWMKVINPATDNKLRAAIQKKYKPQDLTALVCPLNITLD